MQTVLRHSARLCTRVTKRRLQHFSSATPRLSEPRPEDRETQRHEHSVSRKQSPDHQTTEDTAEHAEGRRTAFRRTLRNRKLTELPPPPRLPAWFKNRNVTLRCDETSIESGKDATTIECVEENTGKVLFHFQCSQEAASELISSDGGQADGKEAQAESEHVLEDLSVSTATSIEVEAIVLAVFTNAGRNIPIFTASKSELALQVVDNHGHEYVDNYVDKLARSVGADLVRLDANDLADLTDEYVGQGDDSPGTFATLGHEVFDGQVSAASGSSLLLPNVRGVFEQHEREEEEEDEDEEDEDDEDEREHDSHSHKIKSIRDMIKSQVSNLDRGLGKVPTEFSFAIPIGIMSGKMTPPRQKKKSSEDSDYVQWDDARLAAVLEQIIDSPRLKRESAPSERVKGGYLQTDDTVTVVASLLRGPSGSPKKELRFRSVESVATSRTEGLARTIIHLKDQKELCQSKLGDVIVKRLAKIVQRRRRLGEQIIIVGTSASVSNEDSEASPFITLSIPAKEDQTSTAKSVKSANFFTNPFAQFERHRIALESRMSGVDKIKTDAPSNEQSSHVAANPGHNRIEQINFRNIGSMLRRMRPDQSTDALFEIPSSQAVHAGSSILTHRTLSQELVHRLVLIAIGLSQSYMVSDTVQPIHIALAAAILNTSAESTDMMKSGSFLDQIKGRNILSGSAMSQDTSSTAGITKVDQIRKSCNTYETKLLGGVVDAQNIKTTFDDVHVAPDTIEALKTLTTLSLLRPDAFKYGILAKDNLSGLMLYGPPGTGKTLLAKAVAKESKATVLEVSGAQVYEKYVGEGEKMVRAVFTLAKKLSPCVVFIDEADALFGTRNSSSNRATHRELINQFLREWDGMDDHRVFIMVATNRPFDVDDAVLRRLPRRLLVDLPVAKDRENILGIHLRDEAVDSAVSLTTLAEQTPLYSGSDLKNLCVSAALAAVREENELQLQHADDAEFRLPEKRTLVQKHFDKGLQEISASISEDMSSLNAIRKFDEQYGDRKGRKKKASYGFGAADAAVDENAARVRQGT